MGSQYISKFTIMKETWVGSQMGMIGQRYFTHKIMYVTLQSLRLAAYLWLFSHSHHRIARQDCWPQGYIILSMVQWSINSKLTKEKWRHKCTVILIGYFQIHVPLELAPNCRTLGPGRCTAGQKSVPTLNLRYISFINESVHLIFIDKFRILNI